MRMHNNRAQGYADLFLASINTEAIIRANMIGGRYADHVRETIEELKAGNPRWNEYTRRNRHLIEDEQTAKLAESMTVQNWATRELRRDLPNGRPIL